MKQLLTLFFSLAVLLTVKAQMHGDGHGNFVPDSLTATTLSGTVIIQNDFQHPQYFLDTNNDGIEDYKLNFGPYWYEPDSSNAVRPADGEQVTVTGGLHESISLEISTLVVYEINGEFWRDPYFAYWNDFGGHNHGSGGHHMGGCNGYAFGWNHDTLETVTVNGTALVDTTFFMNHFYLDTDNDTLPNYFLNFGPWWYEPSSGAQRPSNGEQITITGGLIDGISFDKIIVYQINGLEWRDSTNFSGHMGGGWIHKNMNTSSTFHNPYDHDDYFEVNPGWNQSGHHGGMMSDSLFCQILELYPNDIPNGENENHFMGFELGVFNPNGSNNMWNSGSCGGHMNFGSSVNYQIHYNDIQVLGNNIDENSIEAKYWDDQSSSWMIFNNSSVNTETNIITFSGSEVSNFVILTANKITSVENETGRLPMEFSLKQNYPNPFNPSTIIEFSLNEVNFVELNIYDALGQKITTLINNTMEAGSYKYQYDASNLTTGIYFYELKVGNNNTVKKMNLIK